MDWCFWFEFEIGFDEIGNVIYMKCNGFEMIYSLQILEFEFSKQLEKLLFIILIIWIIFERKIEVQ